MDANVNRVYVNPNFNRVPATAAQSDHIHTHNHLYINPNFTRNVCDMQQFNNINRKIYVNPNFIKPTKTLDKKDCIENLSQVNYNIGSVQYSHSLCGRPTLCINEKSKLSENISPRLTSKSRYCLVRKYDNNVLETKHKIKDSCTIKINKYKSIPFHSFQNNLQMVKDETTKRIPSKANTRALMSQYVKRNNLKLVRHHLKPNINMGDIKLTPKSLKLKRNTNLKSQLKVLNGSRTKNNIPCRLFTKYGKCLRNLYGNCEYLHDKKHVSLCRKFIKGICHDKKCLLSHELSSKKMPTCFFYLNGMCTKVDCPYLHVKLSEKSKICPDFLKGYCDKGEMCLNRHVRQSTHKSNDKKHSTPNKYTYRNVKVNILKSVKPNELKRILEGKNTKTDTKNCHNEKSIDEGDCRYFKDLQNTEPMCEVLKPTRCKLGTLPSFIRL